MAIKGYSPVKSDEVKNTDTEFYDLVWNGDMMKPSPENAVELAKRGLMIGDKTPRIVKVPSGINQNNGLGQRWYIENPYKSMRTLEEMELQIGLSAKEMRDFWNEAKEYHPNRSFFVCDICRFDTTDKEAYDHHMNIMHGGVTQAEIDSGEKEKPYIQCEATTANGERCTREVKMGTRYCAHPSHQRFTAIDNGITTSETGVL